MIDMYGQEVAVGDNGANSTATVTIPQSNMKQYGIEEAIHILKGE